MWFFKQKEYAPGYFDKGFNLGDTIDFPDGQRGVITDYSNWPASIAGDSPARDYVYSVQITFFDNNNEPHKITVGSKTIYNLLVKEKGND